MSRISFDTAKTVVSVRYKCSSWVCVPHQRYICGYVSVSQGEIEALYHRFRALDRGHKVKPVNKHRRENSQVDFLERSWQGYISAEEFMNIPELSINPLAQRLERVFESVNFRVSIANFVRNAWNAHYGTTDWIWLICCRTLYNRLDLVDLLQDFVYLLSAFSTRAAVIDKVHLIFAVYDSDGDGMVSADDMELMLRQLAGNALRLKLLCRG